MSIHGLPRSGRSRVYQRIVDILKTDPVLSSIVGLWICHDGDRDDVGAMFSASGVTVVTSPGLDSQRWAYADAQKGDLVVTIDFSIPCSTDARDWLDVWDAIERAVYPADDRKRQFAIERRLRGEDDGTCGRDAETGQVVFTRPANAQSAADDGGNLGWQCSGSLSISILRGFNP